jgi:hypothetical protein
MARPKIPGHIIEKIHSWRGEGQTIDEICGELEDEVSRGTVAKYTKQYDEMSEGERRKDEPWHMGLSHPDITPEATGDLMELLRLSIALGRKFTVRQAIWACKIRSAFSGESPSHLYIWSTFYERVDRTAAGTNVVPDMSTLDAEIAFKVWKGGRQNWEYEQAVLTGNASTISDLRGIKVVNHGELQSYPIMTSGLSDEARAFLRNTGGMVIDDEPWWPQAESIMTFWLRYIRSNAERWSKVGYSSLPEVDEEDWERLGSRLAELVIEKAKRLSVNPWEQERIGGPMEISRPTTWRPLEVLESLGIANLGPLGQEPEI